jgi:bacteriocin-like protein
MRNFDQFEALSETELAAINGGGLLDGLTALIAGLGNVSTGAGNALTSIGAGAGAALGVIGVGLATFLSNLKLPTLPTV